MKKFVTSAFIVLTMMLFGSALSSSADQYYYYNKGHSIERHRVKGNSVKKHHRGSGHSVERHGGQDRGYRLNLITPSNPFDDELRNYYHRGDNERYYYSNDYERRYYYYDRDYDDDDVDFKLDIF